MKAPKWLQRPCGAVFGFGGKIAMFGPPAPGGAPTVSVLKSPNAYEEIAECI